MDWRCSSNWRISLNFLVTMLFAGLLGNAGCKTSAQSHTNFDMVGQGCVASDAECQSICGILAFKTTHKTGACAQDSSAAYQCFCEQPLPESNIQNPEMEGYIYRGCMANNEDCARDCTTGDSVKRNFLAITDGPCSKKSEDVYAPIDCWCKFSD